MKINIRRADKSDAILLQDLNRKIMVNNVQYDPRFNPNWEQTDYGRSFFEDRCTQPNWYTIIAEADGKPIGYLNGSIDNFGYRYPQLQKVAVIENVGVIPEYQNKGIGKLLMEDFKKWAKENKAIQIQLTSFSKNTQALDWYKKLGFEPSDIILQKDIK